MLVMPGITKKLAAAATSNSLYNFTGRRSPPVRTFTPLLPHFEATTVISQTIVRITCRASNRYTLNNIKVELYSSTLRNLTLQSRVFLDQHSAS
jgi:hypothetical protein